ncbi:MAG: glycoside hydrolase family 172 protein [Phycisphaerales bacterium JB039]
MWRSACALAVFLLALPAWAQPITVESLLEEMLDRDAAARWPEPAYTCRQFSSYDRRSITPEDHEAWFANADASQYLRVEEVQTPDGVRREWVMMDAEGPGAIVRMWSANPKGTMRIYLDGAAEPAITVPLADALGGRWIAPDPLSYTAGRGWNLWLPIPYAERCKVTSDSDGFYYQINYRTYEPGTEAQSVTADELERLGGMIARVARQLAIPDAEAEASLRAPMDASAPGVVIEPGDSVERRLPAGPRAIRRLTLSLTSDDMDNALRSTVIESSFDGERTIWAPVGDFFGVGQQLVEFEDHYRGATATDGGAQLACAWVMPYRRSGSIRLINLGEAPVTARLTMVESPWEWDDRSMRFHANWRQEDPIHTRPMRDWNYITIDGRGVYMGDTLAVINDNETWWGEGDEKIYVDGEDFPSHFGTGTEDYYSYAWCSNEVFWRPFNAQPRCDGYTAGGNWGRTTVTRVRALDAIPFTTDFRFDMEVWHWAECDVAYAATTYWYGAPGASANIEPMTGEAARGALTPKPLPPPFAIEGAIEAEKLEITARSRPDLPAGAQDMRGFGRGKWSGEQHLWVQGARAGDFVELRVPAPSAEPVKVIVYGTKSWDYGIVRFTVNGGEAREVDLYNAEQRAAAPTGPIELGVFEPVDGALHLRLEVVGSNERSEGSGAFFGIDCIVLEPAN